MYHDKDADLAIKRTKKNDLEENPLVCLFEYRIFEGKEGY